MKHILNTLGAIVFAIVVFAAYAIAGDTDNNRGEWVESQHLKELQAAEAGSARQQAAAQALCNEQRGPNSEARWTPDGDLVCTTRRGVRQVSL